MRANWRPFRPRKADAGVLCQPLPDLSRAAGDRAGQAAAERLYFLTRYDDLVAAYKNTKAFSSDKKKEFSPKYGASLLYEHHTTSLVFNDPPAHTRVRRLIMGALSPRAIAGMEPDLIRLVDRLLDAIAAKGKVDLIDDFAAAIPIEVIGNLLDVPRTSASPCATGRWPSSARWSR
jgi:cytochrome P450